MQRHRTLGATTPPLMLALALGLGACDEAESSQDGIAASSAAVSPLASPWATRTTEGQGFPCEVDAVLAASCRRCHWDPTENDAPFGMTTWDGLREDRSGEKIFVLMQQMIEADLMPPLDAIVTPSVAPLSEAQKTTLLSWLKAGAPRFEGACP